MSARVVCAAGVALVASLGAAPAGASEPVSGFIPRFDLETGRVPVAPPEVGLLRLMFHGEYQLRAQLQSDTPLRAPAEDPGATTLGQRGKIVQWFRVTPRFQIATAAEIVGQIDLFRGIAAGATARHQDAAADPESETNPIRPDPRWLYLQLNIGTTRVRVGQQPLHLGTGMLFNDGDHPTLFGDYFRGDSSERVQVSMRPGGRTGQLALWAAGDLIYRDAHAQLTRGDLAWQGMAGVILGNDVNHLGAFGVVRRQRRRDSEKQGIFLDSLDTQTLDVYGRFAVRAPGAAVYVYGEGELAVQRGQENEARTPSEQVRAWGMALRLGVAHERSSPDGRFANAVGTVGWGFASGDDQPLDGTEKRFAMSHNFNVGLVLFDHVLHAQSARSATIARRAPQAIPGETLLPTNGAVAGAAYVNPTLVLRPRSWLDLKAGLLVAQATADVVDLASADLDGLRRSHAGGPANRRNLGLELDSGVEVRLPLSYGMSLQLGVQAGLLLPGDAFDDASGGSMPPQHLEALRVGFQY